MRRSNGEHERYTPYDYVNSLDLLQNETIETNAEVDDWLKKKPQSFREKGRQMKKREEDRKTFRYYQALNPNKRAR